MSFYVKLFFLVALGTVVCFITISRLIKSTDHMPETFSTSTTSYVASDQKEEPVIKAEPVAVREKSEIEIEIEKERGAIEKAALERRELRMSNEENSLRQDVYTTDTGDDEALEPLPITQSAEEEETDDNQTANNGQSNDGGPTTEQSRADSDADIQAQKNAADTDSATIDDPTDIKLSIRKSASDALNIKQRAETVQALDLAYAPPVGSTCTFPDNNVVSVGVDYRKSSYAIKGQSLANIDQLIKLYNKCGGGKMLVLENVEGQEDTEERLIQQRKDEVKYYLLQRRVPKDDMIFSDNS